LKIGRPIRSIQAALLWALAAGLFASGCSSVARPEARPAAEEQQAAEAGQQPSEKTLPEQAAPAPASEEEQAGVSLGSPGAPEGAAEAGPGELPEPGANALGDVEVYSKEAPSVPRQRIAEKPLPLPKAGAAPKSAAPKAPPPTAAPGADQGAAASAAKAPAAKAPAPGSASTASQPAASPAPVRLREVLARKGDTVSIEQEGGGWLFLGLPPAGRSPGLLFLSSDTGGRRSTFSFKALEYGEYDLGFQLQDNSRGTLQNETVRLRVLPDEQFREAVARQAAAPEPAPVDPAQLEAAERLFNARAFDLALAEYLKLYRPADPLLNDRLAAIYAETGESEAAQKYYEKNLSAPAPYNERAEVGLVRAGVAQGSEELVREHMKGLLTVRSIPIGRELLDAARLLLERGRSGLAQELLLEYPRRYPRGAELDRAWFLLARLYETESQLRDLAKARQYYKKVYEVFPDSSYAAEAQARVRYLDRYFFIVQ
jgi:tetratricopeptide (TPR) repeat protein